MGIRSGDRYEAGAARPGTTEPIPRPAG